MTDFLSRPLTPPIDDETACFNIIATACADAARYITESLAFRITPYSPHDAPHIFFSDDDTDYLPAASDFIAFLTDFLIADERDYSAFFARLATCDSMLDISPMHADCLHCTAIDFHHALDPYMPNDDNCPNMQ